MRTLYSAVLLVAITVVGLCSIASCAPTRAGPLIVGGWNPIKDVNDPHIQELGSWAVAEHVKQAHDGLQFAEVVSGEEQVVSGMNYKLIIDATDRDCKSATYDAVVYEDASTNARQLKSFVPANRSGRLGCY